jgi:hypothetical protein
MPTAFFILDFPLVYSIQRLTTLLESLQHRCDTNGYWTKVVLLVKSADDYGMDPLVRNFIVEKIFCGPDSNKPIETMFEDFCKSESADQRNIFIRLSRHSQKKPKNEVEISWDDMIKAQKSATNAFLYQGDLFFLERLAGLASLQSTPCVEGVGVDLSAEYTDDSDDTQAPQGGYAEPATQCAAFGSRTNAHPYFFGLFSKTWPAPAIGSDSLGPVAPTQ